MDAAQYRAAMLAASRRRDATLSAVRNVFRPLLEALGAQRERGDFTMTDKQRSQYGEMTRANQAAERTYVRETAPIKAAYGRASEDARNQMLEQKARDAADVKVSPSELALRRLKQRDTEEDQ